LATAPAALIEADWSLDPEKFNESTGAAKYGDYHTACESLDVRDLTLLLNQRTIDATTGGVLG
jgi:hypothetical protein